MQIEWSGLEEEPYESSNSYIVDCNVMEKLM